MLTPSQFDWSSQIQEWLCLKWQICHSEHQTLLYTYVQNAVLGLCIQTLSSISIWDNLACLLTVYYSVRPRGSHLHAAYSSVCDQNQGFLSAKNYLIIPFWGPWALDFQRVKGQIIAVCSWSIDFSKPWSLDQPPKGGLITWFNFDSSHKRCYTGHISDYPL